MARATNSASKPEGRNPNLYWQLGCYERRCTALWCLYLEICISCHLLLLIDVSLRSKLGLCPEFSRQCLENCSFYNWLSKRDSQIDPKWLKVPIHKYSGNFAAGCCKIIKGYLPQLQLTAAQLQGLQLKADYLSEFREEQR